MAQFKALLIVADRGGVTGRELSKSLGIGPSAVTSLVDRLVERKLVRREDDPADRRLGEHYYEVNRAVIDLQLARAGARLAALLNTTLTVP